ncbi:MAG: NAD(P)-binding domain-containing protein [Acidobacteria bacterium]|nr:NAD(P)-binding domain-containing protein [Acidobacteriota bacterium]
MMNGLTYVLLALVFVLAEISHIRSRKKKEELARAGAEKGKLFSEGPKAQHPYIDVGQCIGCGACTDVCPEGDVLGVIGGKASIINGHKCIGHGLCAEACPVGAIAIVMASPAMGADLPRLTPEFETSVRNMFVVGELGGLALVKNAVNQGRDCIDTIARRIKEGKMAKLAPGVVDVCIVGAGPGGISASLRAIENKITHVTVEQDEFGGTVAKYPRQKLVMTSPVEFPMYGKFKKLEISKEELLSFWGGLSKRADLNVRTHEKVEEITRGGDGVFTVQTSKGVHRSRSVILALGRRGTPKKLGVAGEDLPKVMYSLIEAEAYTNAKILVVGGGDSAIEAAMGLAHQKGNQVTLSYRKEAFSRIKERNALRIEECIRKKMIRVIFESNPVEFRQPSVLLDVKGPVQEIPNDYAWVFAGGTPPNDFLRKVGVEIGTRDLTADVKEEAKLKGYAA